MECRQWVCKDDNIVNRLRRWVKKTVNVVNSVYYCLLFSNKVGAEDTTWIKEFCLCTIRMVNNGTIACVYGSFECRAISICMYPVIWILSILPMRFLYLISDLFYLLLFYVFGYRKQVVFDNLRMAFPNKTDKELFLIRKKFFKHFELILWYFE